MFYNLEGRQTRIPDFACMGPHRFDELCWEGVSLALTLSSWDAWEGEDEVVVIAYH